MPLPWYVRTAARLRAAPGHPDQVVLEPGGSASVTIHTLNRQGACLPTSAQLRIYPPGDTASLVIPGEITNCATTDSASRRSPPARPGTRRPDAAALDRASRHRTPTANLCCPPSGRDPGRHVWQGASTVTAAVARTDGHA
ncbi:DUF4232 domain-containing protein [Streptomyces sp. NBC_01589]|uniref:DUF4232 domain-containing protein n=1 Tax=unclassified Streptomyces TaxID=2593676 RepID=UPI003864D199